MKYYTDNTEITDQTANLLSNLYNDDHSTSNLFEYIATNNEDIANMAVSPISKDHSNNQAYDPEIDYNAENLKLLDSMNRSLDQLKIACVETNLCKIGLRFFVKKFKLHNNENVDLKKSKNSRLIMTNLKKICKDKGEKRLRRCNKYLEKKLNCPFENCSKSYASRSSLKLHMKINHNINDKKKPESKDQISNLLYRCCKHDLNVDPRKVIIKPCQTPSNTTADSEQKSVSIVTKEINTEQNIPRKRSNVFKNKSKTCVKQNVFNNKIERKQSQEYVDLDAQNICNINKYLDFKQKDQDLENGKKTVFSINLTAEKPRNVTNQCIDQSDYKFLLESYKGSSSKKSVIESSNKKSPSYCDYMSLLALESKRSPVKLCFSDIVEEGSMDDVQKNDYFDDLLCSDNFMFKADSCNDNFEQNFNESTLNQQNLKNKLSYDIELVNQVQNFYPKWACTHDNVVNKPKIVIQYNITTKCQSN